MARRTVVVVAVLAAAVLGTSGSGPANAGQRATAPTTVRSVPARAAASDPLLPPVQPFPSTYTGHTAAGTVVKLTYDNGTFTGFTHGGTTVHHTFTVDPNGYFLGCASKGTICLEGNWTHAGTVQGKFVTNAKHFFALHSDTAVPNVIWGRYKACNADRTFCLAFSYDRFDHYHLIRNIIETTNPGPDPKVLGNHPIALAEWRIPQYCGGHVEVWCIRGHWDTDNNQFMPDITGTLHVRKPNGTWHTLTFTREWNGGFHQFDILGPYFRGHDIDGRVVEVYRHRGPQEHNVVFTVHLSDTPGDIRHGRVPRVGPGSTDPAMAVIHDAEPFYGCSKAIEGVARVCTGGYWFTESMVRGWWWAPDKPHVKHAWSAVMAAPPPPPEPPERRTDTRKRASVG